MSDQAKDQLVKDIPNSAKGATDPEKTQEFNVDLLRAYHSIFDGSPEANMVLWDILEQCKVYHDGYNPDHKHPRDALLIHNGKRSIGLQLLKKLETKITAKAPVMAVTHKPK